jgi:hypothetical protein
VSLGNLRKEVECKVRVALAAELEQQSIHFFLTIYALLSSGPIELEEADLITMTPPLSTPDLDRRETSVPPDKAKKESSGIV